jgi:hypothetical protein
MGCIALVYRLIRLSETEKRVAVQSCYLQAIMHAGHHWQPDELMLVIRRTTKRTKKKRIVRCGSTKETTQRSATYWLGWHFYVCWMDQLQSSVRMSVQLCVNAVNRIEALDAAVHRHHRPQKRKKK